MPNGDCEDASDHQAFSPTSLSASVDTPGLPSRTDSNHASVASQLVQTSRLGPAARYNGILATSTMLRKRRASGGMASEDAPSGDARPTSILCQSCDWTQQMAFLPLTIWPSGRRTSPLHISTIADCELRKNDDGCRAMTRPALHANLSLRDSTCNIFHRSSSITFSLLGILVYYVKGKHASDSNTTILCDTTHHSFHPNPPLSPQQSSYPNNPIVTAPNAPITHPYPQ
jgi:hypothetical protein